MITITPVDDLDDEDIPVTPAVEIDESLFTHFDLGNILLFNKKYNLLVGKILKKVMEIIYTNVNVGF